MMLTGSVILGLLVSHLFDFRLNPNEDEVHLDRQVMELLDQRHRRVKNALYWLMVLAVSVHAWRGNTKAWMYRLGFRGDREISLLHRLCQVLILVSAGLYSIPLAMKNPYSQSTEFMAGPRIITVA
jgi:succinate dehydrogenase hydrophobic anchor subunit